MVKRDTSKLVGLPNQRTFYWRYKRAKHANLQANVRLERVYRQRATPRGRRRQQPRQAAAANQQGQGIGDFLRVAKKIAKSKIARNREKSTWIFAQNENLSGKIKNKKLKKIFDLDSPKKLVRYGSSYGQNKLE